MAVSSEFSKNSARGNTIVLKVVIADDLCAYAMLLREMLERHPAFHVVGDASAGEEAIRLVEMWEADLLVCDVDLPDIDGIAVTVELRSRGSSTKVVLISGHTEKAYERLAKDSGAVAFVPKSQFTPERLVEALESGTQR